jgi:hypothetical protein
VSEFGQLLDHAAELQRSVDRLWSELLLVWLAVLALATALAVQAWHSWRFS